MIRAESGMNHGLIVFPECSMTRGATTCHYWHGFLHPAIHLPPPSGTLPGMPFADIPPIHPQGNVFARPMNRY
jgi:hypothetical protein